jgi:cell division protein FtsQ
MARTVSGPRRRPGEPGRGAGSGSRPGKRKRRVPGRGGGARVRGLLRRLHWKALLVALTALVIVGVTAWALLGSRLLVVRSVQVAGNGTEISASQVLAAAHVTRGQPLIRVDTGAIARRVAQLRQVQSAQVSKDWPTTVVITVQLRRPLFVLPVQGGYALVDAFGVNVRDATSRPPGLPLLTVNTDSGTLRNSPAVRAAAAVLAELPRRAARQVRGVTTGGPNDVSVKLANGATVIWGGAERGSFKAAELQILMRRRARVYDVSGVGTAVTKG